MGVKKAYRGQEPKLGPTYCQAADKFGYGSKPAAKAALHRLQRDRDGSYEGNVYRCPHCRRWHVGRITRRRSHVFKESGR